jgi:hypothetical protein
VPAWWLQSKVAGSDLAWARAHWLASCAATQLLLQVHAGMAIGMLPVVVVDSMVLAWWLHSGVASRLTDMGDAVWPLNWAVTWHS